MKSVVVDTHTLLWYLTNSPRISANALAAIQTALDAGSPVYVAAITVVEVLYLEEKGRLPSEALRALLSALDDPHRGFIVVPLDLEVCEALQSIPREVIPDMPDRVIAATSQMLQLPLVTHDEKIGDSGIETLW